MRGRLIGILAVSALLGCAGLANDINKGASTTERELTGEPRSYPPERTDAGAGAGTTSSDAAVPFFAGDASGDLHL